MFRHRLPDKVDISLLAKGREGKFTPDLHRLEQYQWQLLFLADDFMPRHPRWNWIEDFVIPGVAYPAWTAEGWYSMWRVGRGQQTYPIPLVNHFSNTFKGRIKGVIVPIRPYMFVDLDKHRMNGLVFRRVRSSFLVPTVKKAQTRIGPITSPESLDLIRAWMYIGRSEFWDDKIDSGFSFKQVQSYWPNPKTDKWTPGRYYYFSLNEYQGEDAFPIYQEETDPFGPRPRKQITFTVRTVINGNYEQGNKS